MTGLIELLLKHPARLDQLTRDEARQADLIPRFLGIALFSFSIFALALVLLLRYADRQALPPILAERWTAVPARRSACGSRTRSA